MKTFKNWLLEQLSPTIMNTLASPVISAAKTTKKIAKINSDKAKNAVLNDLRKKISDPQDTTRDLRQNLTAAKDFFDEDEEDDKK